MSSLTAEAKRLEEARQHTAHWKRWGPYLSERAWGTVREDYSADGDAWEYFPHDHARSRAYRWNEDGIAGLCDKHQRICFALSLWNEADPILKERLYGLTGKQGNHAEDVKEYYFYLDSTPTHSYMSMLYKYPQAAYPYEQLKTNNAERGKHETEFELLDTGVFNEDRYFDVTVRYAKASADDLLIEVEAINRGSEAAPLHLLPTVWFRNQWSWSEVTPDKPELKAIVSPKADYQITELTDAYYGQRWLYSETPERVLYTENETNNERLFDVPNATPYVKDSINDYVVHQQTEAVNPTERGTKAAAHYRHLIPAGEKRTIRLRLSDSPLHEMEQDPFGPAFTEVFETRLAEANAFYEEHVKPDASEDEKAITRQAFAGMMWSKQYYHYVVKEWLEGDSASPPPPAERKAGRNSHWQHLHNADVISMPDKWEYPWYAAWDLAFHCVTYALIDPDFAKHQLLLMMREWYMHPNGQLPAYEWSMGDVNPPVFAWAALQVYAIDAKQSGVEDKAFLERAFHKLMLNFSWWVNRKDKFENNLFEGGFLGLDNISLFDRSSAVPEGSTLEQADGTAWMAMFSLNLFSMALELAEENPAYEDTASKFWEHYLHIAEAMNDFGPDHHSLWCEETGFYYDMLHLSSGEVLPLKVRSLVGLIPLFSVETVPDAFLEQATTFKKRMDWLLNNKPELTNHCACIEPTNTEQQHLFAMVDESKLRKLLAYLLDENEFLSPHGIRSLSKAHTTPYTMQIGSQQFSINYQPGESTTYMFGGNSNWRGPIWFPINYLIIDSLRKHHAFYQETFTVECPTGSGVMMTLEQVADELSSRLVSIFKADPEKANHRPVYEGNTTFQTNRDWSNHILFYEYFHGETGRGLGASHQTGWTGLVANLLQARTRTPVQHRHTSPTEQLCSV